MDTLVMHRTLTEAGFPEKQADAVVKVLQGGVVTKQDLDLAGTRLKQDLDLATTGLKQDLDLATTRLESRIERLENKVNLILGVAVLAVLAPAVTRLLVGP